MNKKIISRIRDVLLILLPVVLFFSYHPVITIGTNETMNLELSLPEIWLVIYSLFCLPQIRSILKFYRKKKIALAAVIPLYFTISLLWSENRLRTFLTVGMLWLVAFSVLNIIYRLKMARLEKKPAFGGILNVMLTSLLVSAVVMSVYCWIQSVLDVSGVPRETTLLCRGCVSTAFGFPHPSGFAIEPQFMGNLLIAPVLLSYYLLFSSDKASKKDKIIITSVAVFLSATLFFTFSRGAIYAVTAGAAVELFLLAKKRQKSHKNIGRRIAKVVTVFISSFILSLCTQGIFAAAGPTNDTFFSGVTKSIHQLTLGVIDMRPSESKATGDTSNQSPAEQYNPETEQPEQPTVSADSAESDFSGYVPESTNRRLNLSHFAYDTWKSDQKYLWLGAGLGGSGIAMNRMFPAEVGMKEIVQNEYASLLLEGGLIGCALILFVALTTIRVLREKKVSPVFWSVIISFLITLMFFSGLPNALQIYLLPAILVFL